MIRPFLKFLLILLAPLALQAAPYHTNDLVDRLRPIGREVSVFEDPAGTLSADEVFRSGTFVRSEEDVPNLGSGGSAFWLRMKLDRSSITEDLVLEIPHPEIDELDMYYLEEGRAVHFVHNGQARKFNELFPEGRKFSFTLPSSPEQLELLIRVKSMKQLQVPMILRSAPVAAKVAGDQVYYVGIFIGMMLVLAFYNFFIFLSTRDASYLRYVIYILLVFLTQLTFYGIAPVLLWPDNGFLLTRSSLLLTIFTAIAATEFTKRFLRTSEFAPRLHKGIPYFYALFAIAIATYFGPWPWVGYQIAQAVSGIYAFYVYAIGVVVWRKGSRQAGFFLIAWSLFLIGTMVFVMKDMGILPYNNFTIYLMPVGSAIEGVLLSFGLADHINILRKEKELSQAESLRISKENERIIREQNVILEDRVRERTHALQESNENLKQTQTQLVNAEKMASLGQLTAGIAHEINNPINFITSNIKPLRRNIGEIVEVMQEYRRKAAQIAQLEEIRKKEEQLGIQDSIDELDDIINSIAEGSSRTAEIVRGLRNFSRLDESDLKESDLNEGIRNTITVLGPQYRDRVRIEMDLQQIPQVECYPGKVNQVFMNILTNAVQATLAKPDPIERIVSIATRQAGDHVIISIKDNGIGMSEEVKARIYDPFFTTKPVGEGTGLGMAIVYGIIEDHHGSIEIGSTPGIGTEFRIALPISHMKLNERRA